MVAHLAYKFVYGHWQSPFLLVSFRGLNFNIFLLTTLRDLPTYNFKVFHSLSNSLLSRLSEPHECFLVVLFYPLYLRNTLLLIYCMTRFTGKSIQQCDTFIVEDAEDSSCELVSRVSGDACQI
jgi:hypothetical protein